MPSQPYEVRVRLDGPRMTVYVDGQVDLEAEDGRFAAGTLALYAWGDEGVSFRNLVFRRK